MFVCHASRSRSAFELGPVHWPPLLVIGTLLAFRFICHSLSLNSPASVIVIDAGIRGLSGECAWESSEGLSGSVEMI